MTGVIDHAEPRFGPVLLEGASRREWRHDAADPEVLDRALATIARIWRPDGPEVCTGSFDAWDEPVRGRGVAVDLGSWHWTQEILELEPTRRGRVRLRLPSGARLRDKWSIVDGDRQERVVSVVRDGDSAWAALEDAATSVQIDRTGRRSARLVLVDGVPWHVGAWDPRPDEHVVWGAPVGEWRRVNTEMYAEVEGALAADGWVSGR